MQCRDTNFVFGKFSRSSAGFNLYSLIADGTENDLIVPRKRLGNSLRVHDDVNVSGRSAIRDTDRLISLVPKSGPLTTLQKKRYEGESRDAELEDPVSGSRLMRLACLCFRFRLCFRWFGFLRSGRFVFLASCRFRFLACWSLRFFRWCSLGFLLLLCRLRFRLLFGGRFRCLGSRGSRLLLLSLLFRDSLIFRKHPVLQISRNNIRRFSVLINLDHASSRGSAGPRRNTLHKDSVDWCLEMFRGELPHRQPVRRSCSFVVNN